MANHLILDSILNSTQESFETSNLWEDYGISPNDNRFKNLNIMPCGLISIQNCQDFKSKVDYEFDYFFDQDAEVYGEKFLINQISISLLGLSSKFITVDLDNEINWDAIAFENYTSTFLHLRLTIREYNERSTYFILYCIKKISRNFQIHLLFTGSYNPKNHH